MSNRQRWLYTAAILIMMMFLAAVHQLRPAQLSDMIGFYQLTDSQQGLPASVYSVGLMLAMLLAIMLTGRIRKPLLLLIAFIAGALTLLPQYFMPAYGVFLGLNVLMGIALGLLDSLVSANMADLHTGRRGAIMMSMLHASYGIGGMVAPVAYSGLMSSGVAWNMLFIIAAAAGAVLLVYVGPVSLRQTALTQEQTGEGAKFSAGMLKEFFTDRTMLTFVVMMFCFAMFFNGSNNWLIRFVEVEYESKISGTVLSMVFVGLTAGRLLLPLLPIGTELFLKVSGFAYAVVMFGALLIGNDIAMAVCCCIGSCIAGPIIPFAMSLACGRMQDNTLFASTMLNLALAVGQIVVAPIMGAFEGAFGIGSAMAFAYAFAAIGSIIAVVGLSQKRAR
ncbi:MAG: MFS transporter [Clostridia bacterium]|nr:MFS transporter [Clostridia bacterium]